MTDEHKEFSVTFDETEGRVAFQGSMRLRSAREYDEVKGLLRSAHNSERPKVILDFRRLEFLNSSGISTIGQFLVEARKARKVKVVLLGSTAMPWQQRSLQSIQRIWDEAELVME